MALSYRKNAHNKVFAHVCMSMFFNLFINHNFSFIPLYLCSQCVSVYHEKDVVSQSDVSQS